MVLPVVDELGALLNVDVVRAHVEHHPDVALVLRRKKGRWRRRPERRRGRRGARSRMRRKRSGRRGGRKGWAGGRGVGCGREQEVVEEQEEEEVEVGKEEHACVTFV